MNGEEPILEFVRRRLDEARGEWPLISRESGVPYFTIANIVQGKSADPRIGTLQPLVDWFRQRDVSEAREAAT